MLRSVLTITLLFFLTTTLISRAQYLNVLIDNNASETTVAIDPLNTDHLVAGANLRNYYYTSDGGLTWGQSTLNSSWGNAGDPNVTSDGLGNFYYGHLTSATDRIACQRSLVFPPVWSNGTYTGLQPPPLLQDHEWIYGDWDTHYLYMTWSQYDNFSTTSVTDSSHILFSASYDQGNSWTVAQRLDQTGGDLEYLDVIEPRPFTGPDGSVYVSWASGQGILIDKSSDSGQTWMTNDQLVTVVPGGVYYSIPGINRIRSTPFICVDKSQGPNRGTIYISWCDQRNGMGNTDVWLVKSTDGGNTWSNSIRVNDDLTTSHQFLNAMDVDQVTGNIYVCFYDRRNYVSDTTDLYLAYSTDGGNSFTNVQVNQQPFVVDQSAFFGDYIQIAAYNNVIRPVWASFNAFGLSSVYTAIIDGQVLTSGAEHVVADQYAFRLYPNIVQAVATIDFSIAKEGNWSGAVYDLYGNKMKDLFELNLTRGNHKIQMNAGDLPAAIYLCELKSGTEHLSAKFAVMK